MISDQYEGKDEKIFSPRPKAGRIILIGMAFFGIMGILSLILPFLEEDRDKIPLFPVLATPIFAVFFYIFFRHFRALRISYRIDNQGIAQIGGKGIFLTWDEIDDIEINPSIGGMVEMKIRLVNGSASKSITIIADHLQRGGRTILDELQRRLHPLFDKKTREYLSGRKHWNIPLIKDILRLEGDLLFIEFPKLKKQTIPLIQIQRVEWFPGAISGAQTGYLLLEHSSGKIKLPQNIGGLAFFLFALKYLYGLGERINPENEELSQKMDGIRQSQARSLIWLIFASAFIVGAVILFVISFMDVLDENMVDKMGIDSTGTIIKKNRDRSIILDYTDLKGRQHENKFYIEKSFHQKVKEQDKIDIRYHPLQPKDVMFDGRSAVGWKWHLKNMAIAFFLFLLGLIVLIWSFFKAGRYKKNIMQMQRAMPASAIAPVAQFIQPPDLPGYQSPPLPLGAPSLPDSPPGNMKHCARCHNPIMEYYFFFNGIPWCPQCRQMASARPEKPGCLIYLKAFVFGVLGALVAGSLWALACILTGYELGIIAILVGLIVGYAVKRGSGNYSSRLFQVIAILLTFYALAFSMIPVVINEISKDPEMRKTVKDTWNQGLAQGQARDDVKPVYDDEEWEDDDDFITSFTLDISRSTTQTLTEEEEDLYIPPEKNMRRFPNVFNLMKAFLFLLLLVILGIVVLLVSPVVIYFIVLFSNPLSLLFLGIALWEAWRLNRPEKPVFFGPFRDGDHISFDKAEFKS